ncbi:MAG: helix-turn-helix domain-containing protein [Nitrospirae bacterium]|nr:helix-turn-helix domain-containing protein [Nitrospirota bacterium]
MENESVGSFFKQVRETKGLSVDEVASKTRIHPDFLKALEEGNFAKLPEQVFAKGFVRSYARSLGLDEEDAMRRFVESAGVFYNKQSELDRLRVRQLEDERRKQANRKVVIAAAAVAVLGLVLLLNREQSVAPSRQVVEPQSSTKALPPSPGKAVPGSTGVPAPRTSQEPSTGGRGAERTEHAPLSGTAESHPAPATPEPVGISAAKPVESVPLASSSSEPLGGLPSDGRGGREASLALDLEATEVSWVVVQVDGASPHEALLRPGERMRWTATDRFMLTLGNAGGVRVELNGKPQGPFGPSGKVARDILLKR